MQILFLHGLGQNKEAWEPTLPFLQHKNIICPNLFSEDLKKKDFHSLADQLQPQICDQKENTMICGLSLGAVLALELYLGNPQKVSGLILIAPQYKVPAWLIDIQNMIFRILPGKIFEKSGVAKETMIEVSSSMRTLNYTDRLKEIICPVYVICGSRDRSNRNAAISLHSKLKHAELVVVEGAGHEVNVEAPKKLAEIVNDACDHIANILKVFEEQGDTLSPLFNK